MKMIKEITARREPLETSRQLSRGFLGVIPEQNQRLIQTSSKTRKGIGRNIYAGGCTHY